MATSPNLSLLVSPESVFTKSTQGSQPPAPTQSADDPKSAVYRAIAVERANGRTVEEIAEAFDMSVPAVDALVRTKRFVDLVLKLQVAQSLTYDERIEKLANIALEKQARILMASRDDKTVLAVSEKILDRAKGRAAQTVNMRSINLNVTKDLDELDESIAQVNQRIASLTNYIEAETSKVEQAKPADIIND